MNGFSLIIIFIILSFSYQEEDSMCLCEDPLYCYKNHCINSCIPQTYANHFLRRCINCATKSLYLFNGLCVPKESLPVGTFVSNYEFNVVSQCGSQCFKCEIQADQCRECIEDSVCKLYCDFDEYITIEKPLKCNKCYTTCATCNSAGNKSNHNCLTCKDGYESFTSSLIECHKKCSDSTKERWIMTMDSEVVCLKVSECPFGFSFYILSNNQCVTSCLDDYSLPLQMVEYKGECFAFCPDDTKYYAINNKCEESNLSLQDLLKIIDQLMPNVNMSIIEEDAFIIDIYNSTKDKEDSKNGLSKIEIGNCETKLRKAYNLKNEEQLIYVKVDIMRSNEITNQVEYRVYNYEGNMLNLDYCKNETVIIVSHIMNTSLFDLDTAKKFKRLGIDIYNQQDPFFVDICFPFTTEDGTDIILRDRLKDIYKNISLCEDNCDYDSVDLEELTVKCICQIKPEIKTKPDPNVFIDSITTTFTDSNFMVIRCYNLVFDHKLTVHNLAFWFYLGFIILHIPNWFYYFIKGSEPIVEYIKKYPRCNPPKTIIVKSHIPVNPEENIEQKGFQLREGIKLLKQDHNKSRHTGFNIDTPKNISSGTVQSNDIRFDNNLNLGSSIYIKNDLEKSFSSSKYQYQASRKDYQSKHDSGMSFSTFRRQDFNNKLRQGMSPMNLQHSYRIEPKKFERDSRRLNTVLIHSNYLKLDITRTNIKKNSINVISELNNSYDKESKGSVQLFFNSFKNKEQNNDIIKGNVNEKVTYKTGIRLMTMLTDNQLQTTTVQDINYNKQKENDKELKDEKAKPSMEIINDYSDINDAKKYDTRSFCRLFYICMLTKHPILATFIKKSQLELRSIIIILFIFGIIIDFAFNALFFTDNLISNRYNYKGYLGLIFTLGNNLVSTIASFAVSLLILWFLSLLSTSQKSFEFYLKTQRKLKNYRQLLKHVLICYKIKLGFFMVFELLFFIMCWYYTMAFCAVYQNSQLDWIISGCITFVIGMCLPFAISIMIVLLRNIAIEKGLNCLYKVVIWYYEF